MNPIFQGNAIFWVEVDKIRPNPFQPRRQFDEAKLRDLAESIRQYGILQPLVVTRYEITREDGGLSTGYELIAGERRLRAASVAGLSQVPVIIRTGEESDKMKLELAIIENLQREDLNPIERALAFDRLIKEFGFTHIEVGRRVGKSRVYVTNTMRLLCLGEDMKQAVIDGKITEGHTRPLLMLGDRPEEQTTLFREIMIKQLNVREAERIAREIAVERARKKVEQAPEIAEMEQELSARLGTRVRIESTEQGGGRVMIEYFSAQDLAVLRKLIANEEQSMDMQYSANTSEIENAQQNINDATNAQENDDVQSVLADEEIEQELEEDTDLYAVRNFTI